MSVTEQAIRPTFVAATTIFPFCDVLPPTDVELYAFAVVRPTADLPDLVAELSRLDWPSDGNRRQAKRRLRSLLREKVCIS